MKYKVILNPYANRWSAGAKAQRVTALLNESGIEYELTLTEGPGHATELATTAVSQGYDVVVAAGGDGTINEVANGLLRYAGSETTIPLGILPIGTGNDLSDMVGIPRNVADAVKVLANLKTRQIDSGLVNQHYFNNNCALAMEPMVSIENDEMKHLSGKLRYVVALIRALRKLKAWHMQIEWDGGSYEGPIYLLSVCNSPRAGGQFYMAPDAQVDDGMFDFVMAPEVPMRTVLAILPRLFNGSHIHHPVITMGRSPFLRITSVPGTPIHADGQLLSRSETHIRYDILPHKLTLITT